MDLKTLFPEFHSPELLASIEEKSSIKNFKAGTVIIDFGSYIKFTPLLLKGVIKIVREDKKGNELFMYYLNPGDTCAVSLTCCMSEQKSEIRAIAEEDVELLAIPANLMDAWMFHFLDWKNFIMNTYRKRFDELLKTIDEIAFNKMDVRLKNYLKKKALVTGKNKITSTHQEIATDLGTSREVISRLLKQLEKKGGIELGRNTIDVSELR